MKKLCAFLVCAVLAGAVLSYAGIASAFWDDEPIYEVLRIVKADGQEYVFEVEVASTPRAMQKGLMNRTFLPENGGMLFVFADEGPRVFWMKDTLIPLDMLFIAKDGRINHIHQNAKPQDETHITSDRPAMAILEINGGQSYKLGLEEGDRVLHPAFRNEHTAQ